MTALVDFSDFVSKVTGANVQHLTPFKVPRVAGILPIVQAGYQDSLWLFEGQPGAGVTPTTVAIPDNTTQGAVPVNTPGGGRQAFLTSGAALTNVAGQFRLYDRLLHIGGLSGTNTGAQTVGGVITRHTDGLGNKILAEIYTQIGATPTTITASYTNQAGVSGKSTIATTFGGTSYREIYRLIELPLAAGDTGVQSIQSVTVLASTGTAGNFGITMVHDACFLSTYNDRTFLAKDSGPVDVSNACLFWAINCYQATVGLHEFSLTVVES